MEEKIKIIDESDPRRYWTQIPNIIANHSSANDQALYFQMKRFAGEKGSCFATKETLMKKLKIGEKALNKSINYLLRKKWIKHDGMIKGKTREIHSYKILDIWKINMKEYEKGQIPSKEGIRIPSKVKTNPLQRRIEEEPIEEELINDKDSKKAVISNKDIFDYFLKEVEKHHQVKPLINYGQCGVLLKRAFTKFDKKQIRSLIDFYIDSDKFDKYGPNLSVALSVDTINKFLMDIS